MSDYRDDREALHARNAALEDALAEKQRELDALKQSGAKSPAGRAARPGRADDSDEALVKLVRSAWVAVVAFVFVLSATLAMAVVTALGGSVPKTPTAVALLAVTALAGGVAVVLAGQPLRRRTGFDVDFMVSRVWLPGFLGLLMPPAALIDAFLRLGSSSVGGYQTTRENGAGGRSYPKVLLPLGEGRPLGVALLLIATLWPATVAVMLFGDKLLGR